MEQLTKGLSLRTIIVLLLMWPMYSHSQTINKLSLQEANELAAKNFPLLKQKQLVRQTAQLTIENIQKGYLPQININGQATYQSDVTSIPFKVPGINFDAPSKDQYKVVSDISQLIYDGGAISQQKKLQQVNAAVEEQKVEVELQKLRERINGLYIGVLLVDEQLKQLNLINKDIDIGISRVAAQVQNGTALRSNLAVLQAEQLKSRQRTTELVSSRKSLLDVLSIFINQPIAADAVLTMPVVDVVIGTPMIERSELKLFQLQDSLANEQKQLVSIKNIPRINVFGQAGYGKPALNLLKNEFSPFAIGGIRIVWPLNNFYTNKREKELVDISRRTIEVQKENFLLNTNVELKRQFDEMEKLEALIQIDKQIIELREQVTTAARTQLENGVLMASDYLREVDAADNARQSAVLHQLQLLQAQLNYNTILGKQ